MYAPLWTTATTTGIANHVIDAFGQNIDGVSIVIGIAVAVPALFLIAELIKGLIVEDRKDRNAITRADSAIAETKSLLK